MGIMRYVWLILSLSRVEHALAEVSFTAPSSLCSDSGIQPSLGGGSPAGGVYSGTGVTDNGDGTTFTFDPSEAGVGTHELSYTHNDDSTTASLQVLDVPDVTFDAPEDVGIDTGKENGLEGGLPVGGVYSGAHGVKDNGDGMSFSFDPDGGVGTYDIKYTYTDPQTGCSASASVDVEVFAESSA